MYGYGTVCYTSGDPLRLVEDAQIIKPNLLAAVPRIYNKWVTRAALVLIPVESTRRSWRR